MKFCYVDESGTGDEPFAVMVGIIVDAQRMHVTKNDWLELLRVLSGICGKEVKEFHTREFYRGNGMWRSINGNDRSEIISAVLKWLKDRKHEVTFAAVNKEIFKSEQNKEIILKDIKSIWCFMGLHLMLTIQKHFQANPKNKGNTIFIFDNEVKEEAHFGIIVNNPPEWTNNYYNKKKSSLPLDQVIDVPYYADSKDVHLIQVADLIAYLLRLYVEIKEKVRSSSYQDEEYKLDNWVEQIALLCLPVSTRYPARGRNKAVEIFYKTAPDSLRKIARK